MTRKKISIEDVDRLIRLYDPNRDMNINNTQKRTILSSILTTIGFYGQRNNVNAVEQAINAVVSRNLYMRQSEAATVIQKRIRKWFNKRERQRQNEQQQLLERQEQLQRQREQDIQELREEFDEDVLDEDGIFDANKYRNKQHQLRRQEQDQRKKKQQEVQALEHQQFLDELHNVPEINIDILFETNYEEISDYIRTHDQYRYHQIEQDNEDDDVIMLCDAQNKEQFDRIKNLALSRHNRETSTLTYSSYNQIDDQKDEQINVNKIKPTSQYYDNVSSLNDIDSLLDKVFKKEKAFVFKIAMDLGVIIERVDGNAESQNISCKYVLPIDANSERRIRLEIRSNDSINQYKQYIRTVIGTMQERTNQDTHEKIIAIFSTMFFVFRFPLGGAAIPSLKQHIRRREIYQVDCKVNLCFWTAYSFITMPNTKDKSWKDLSRIAEAKRIFKRVNGVEFRDNYQGFNFVSDIDNFINKEQVNVHMYTYHSDPSHYELTQNYTVDGSDKKFNILFINDGINAHIMYISDVEALTGFRYCNICHRQAFRIGDKNLQAQMRNHMKKCQKNNGKIVKKIILERFAKPLVPHILSNKTYKYLLANNLTHLFKPTQYYITYDIETLEKKVNEKFGDCSQVIATLVPYAIASTVKSVSGIHSFYFDIRTENFMDKWLEQLFEEAVQVKKDNKYKDETVSKYFEVPVIGLNSAKFDTSLVFKNLKSKDWTITKYLGSSTIAKQIVVKHKRFGVQLRFVDFKIYTTHNRLKDCVRDFGNGTYKKGRFPHEFVNVNNYMEELNKNEPFPIEAFDNKLRNKKLSGDKYKEYLVDAAKFKTRWDYFQYYNILDTRILIEPIDFLINLMFRYKVDMLANISMAQCANAIKYAMCYSDFDINGNYNSESTDKSIEITQCYQRAKVESYIEQDSKKGRDSSNNVTIDDYYYFKDLFKNQRCHICNARFTWKNRPTLDRIDNNKGHSKSNVLPCCLYCNTCKANRDENQMKLMIQLRKYALFKQLPMTLISDEGYQLLRKGITGGLSNVMHRYNVAGETRINHFEYNKENKCVYSVDSDYIQTHVVQLDFHSQYPSVMSGEPNALNPYTNHIIFMPAQLIERITDKDRCRQLIYDTNRFSNDRLVVDQMYLFVAEVKGHIEEQYMNDVINWAPIIRNIDIMTNKETIGEFMYNHLVEHKLPHDTVERKLTNLVDTNNEVMSFNNYYLWLLIDTCHFVIDEIVSVTTFTKHTNFNSFVKEFMSIRQQAKDDKNDGLAQFAKIVLNSAFGGDCLNSEKYSNTKLLSSERTFLQHMMNGFIHSTELNDDLYAVQVDKENCRCNTCLQVAYFVLDSAKFWYVNFIYNFMKKAYDMQKMHFIQCDTDSLTWAISGNVNRGPDQLFEEVIKDQEFYDRYKDCVFSLNGQKQILHIGVEKQGYNCIALSPKNYIINDEIVLKGVILNQNPQINKQAFIDNIKDGKVTTAVNTTLAQRKGTMSRLQMSRNAITGSHTKMIVLRNQSCLPFIKGINADRYFIK